jgi:hypothetical protein
MYQNALQRRKDRPMICATALGSFATLPVLQLSKTPMIAWLLLSLGII